MKFMITGDWHLTNKTPRNRIDDYPTEQWRKTTWIIGECVQRNIKYILQPGDLFDSFNLPDMMKANYITRWRAMFDNNGIKILTIPGQHDMRYHTSDLQNTPMGVLRAADAIEVLDHPEGMPLILDGHTEAVYGAGWGRNIPKIQDIPAMTNILLTHRMVIKQKLWEGQTEYEFGNVLLKNNPFDLIVTGDNHKSFTFKDEDRYLVNCGSLMRSSIDQIDHEPVVYIYDSDKRTLEKLLIPVKAISNIMRIEEAQQEKEKNEKLIAFVEGLKEDTQIEGLDFLNNLKSYLDNNDVDQGVKNIIEEIING